MIISPHLQQSALPLCSVYYFISKLRGGLEGKPLSVLYVSLSFPELSETFCLYPPSRPDCLLRETPHSSMSCCCKLCFRSCVWKLMLPKKLWKGLFFCPLCTSKSFSPQCLVYSFYWTEVRQEARKSIDQWPPSSTSTAHLLNTR